MSKRIDVSEKVCQVIGECFPLSLNNYNAILAKSGNYFTDQQTRYTAQFPDELKEVRIDTQLNYTDDGFWDGFATF